MTRSKRRIPRDEGAFRDWLLNFNNNFPSVAATVDETPSVGRISKDAIAYPYLILRNNAIRAYQKEESQIKDKIFNGDVNDPSPSLPSLNLPEAPDGLVLNPGIEDYASLLVQRIVKHPNCTPEIEALLDIGLKGDDSLAPEGMKPFIKELDAINGTVKIRASLQGMKAFRVFSQRGANDAFESIGDSSQAEFSDERQNLVAGQPETRQYKLIFLENNKPVGEYSAIETDFVDN